MLLKSHVVKQGSAHKGISGFASVYLRANLAGTHLSRVYAHGRGVRRSAGLKGQTPTFPGDAPEDSWVFGGKNNQAMLKVAQDRLTTAQATLDALKSTPDPDSQKQAAAEQQATAAVAKANKDVTEWQSTINRGAVKRATYARATAILTRKAVPKQAAEP
jgi:hypothetical protein